MSFPILRMFISEKPSTSSLVSAGRYLLTPSSSVLEKRDIRYGPHERQKLDIYEPVEIDEETNLIVFFHGGGWATGNKEMHRFIGRSWSKKNLIIVIPNYRLVPEVTYPEQLKDVVRSLAWVSENYDEYNGSFFLSGHSAGAHMAALTGFSERWLGEAKLKIDQICGLILLAGVYQFYPYEKADPRVKRFIGDRCYWEEAQPFNHAKRSLPPVLLAHGKEDREVLLEQSTRLSEKLTNLSVDNELLVEGGAGHLELLLKTTTEYHEFWSLVDQFIKSNGNSN